MSDRTRRATPDVAVDTEPTGRPRIALVTGATGTIGRSIAAGLVDAGWTVATVARSVDRLEALTDDLRRPGGPRVVGYPCDLRDPAAVLGVVAQITGEMGAPSVLVNGAGVIGPLARFQECDVEAWAATIDLNLLGSAFVIHACLPAMIRYGWGRIVNVGSASAFMSAYPGSGAYEVSKSALHVLTKYVAASTEGTGVAVSTLHPGEVRSDLSDEVAREVERTGAAAYGAWLRWLDATGGDPPQLAASRVVEFANDPAPASGDFLWIRGGARAPFPIVDAESPDAPPWRDY